MDLEAARAYFRHYAAPKLAWVFENSKHTSNSAISEMVPKKHTHKGKTTKKNNAETS